MIGPILARDLFTKRNEKNAGYFCTRFKIPKTVLCVLISSLQLTTVLLSFQPSKHIPIGSKPGTQQRDRSISSVSVHSSGRPKSSLSTLTDKGTPEPAIEEVSEDPSALEQEMQYEEQIRLERKILLKYCNEPVSECCVEPERFSNDGPGPISSLVAKRSH